MTCRNACHVSIDGGPSFQVRCSLDAGHVDAHALLDGDDELMIWVTDGDYSGPRAARLLHQLDERRLETHNQSRRRTTIGGTL